MKWKHNTLRSGIQWKMSIEIIQLHQKAPDKHLNKFGLILTETKVKQRPAPLCANCSVSSRGFASITDMRVGRADCSSEASFATLPSKPYRDCSTRRWKTWKHTDYMRRTIWYCQNVQQYSYRIQDKWFKKKLFWKQL
jgi:hypothetical protein